jgi:hypothetical protein
MPRKDTAETLRAYGHQLIDRMADHVEDLEAGRVSTD